METLWQVTRSMGRAAQAAAVQLVTGDSSRPTPGTLPTSRECRMAALKTADVPLIGDLARRHGGLPTWPRRVRRRP